LVGEHGVGLSGGQRQRIAISRALLRVLIFDEATSNLDPTTAEAFARTVNQLRGKATILFIAHHVPRGLQVDRIARFGGAESKQGPSESSVAGERR
jgi:subfamily B ATP-binding cassette protein HlyB/CyaB